MNDTKHVERPVQPVPKSSSSFVVVAIVNKLKVVVGGSIVVVVVLVVVTVIVVRVVNCGSIYGSGGNGSLVFLVLTSYFMS